MRKLHADPLPELVRMALRRRSAPRATATGKTSWEGLEILPRSTAPVPAIGACISKTSLTFAVA